MDYTDEDNITRMPLWRTMMERMLDAGLKPGDKINKHHLGKECGLRKPVTADDKTKYDLQLMSIFQSFRDALLEEHCLDLVAVGAGGEYTVTEPKDQTRLAVMTGQDEVRKALRKMTKRVVFIRLEGLTDEARKENLDAQAKIAALASMVRKTKLLGKS